MLIGSYYMVFAFCIATNHASFGKGGTPDSHGLLGKEFGKTCVCSDVLLL